VSRIQLKNIAINPPATVCLLIGAAFIARAQSPVDYKTQIDPIFSKYSCKQCHGGDGGLSLDTYQHLLTTGFSAPVVVPKDTNCVLVRRLKGLNLPRMPQSGPITSAELQLIIRWIKEGAAETATIVQFSEIPISKFALDQNYPNPFNPNTAIRFSIAKSEFVVLTLYDVLGHEVETLVAEQLPGGKYEITFDAGKHPSGVYLYCIRAGEFTQARMMMLIK
jgi:hypothetical protein